MKLIQLILLTLVMSFSFSHDANAQFLKKLKQKVQQAAEDAVIDKAGQKTEQEVGKAMDSLLDLDPNYQAKNQEQLLNLYMQTDSTIIVEDVYVFNNNVTYEMTMKSNTNPSTVNYSMWFSEKNDYMATEMLSIDSEDSKNQNESLEMLTIFDEKNQAMIIIMEKQKMAQIISMSKIKEIALKEEEENLKTIIPEIKKTGKSKKILGYHCEEFSTITEDGTISFWITQEVKLYQKNIFLNMNKSLGGNKFQNIPDAAKGFMMEMHYENKSDGETGSMIATGIFKKNKTLVTKEYQLMNLSGFMQN